MYDHFWFEKKKIKTDILKKNFKAANPGHNRHRGGEVPDI